MGVCAPQAAQGLFACFAETRLCTGVRPGPSGNRARRPVPLKKEEKSDRKTVKFGFHSGKDTCIIHKERLSNPEAGAEARLLRGGHHKRERLIIMPKTYTEEKLTYIGFPLGGIGAGMFNVEGTGAFSAFSLRNAPNVNLEPCLFSAVTVKGGQNMSRVVEGQVPKYKVYGAATAPSSGLRYRETFAKGTGVPGRTYGLPRFKKASFTAEFPFAHVRLEDDSFPLEAELTAWSPFTPPEPDDSSLPLAYLEYTFHNRTEQPVEAVYYFSSMNFMAEKPENGSVYRYGNGFVLAQKGTADRPWDEGAFCAQIHDPAAKVNTALFRGGWFDPLTMLWNDILAGEAREASRENDGKNPNPGASLSLPFRLEPGEKKTIVVSCAWYVPESALRAGHGEDAAALTDAELAGLERYRPWYTTRFEKVEDAAAFAAGEYSRLRQATRLFTDTFYASTLPDVVLEAVSANLGILKSPTVLRQRDGRLWCWEGCCDSVGSCHGSCTHVWNYAQALCHLFPSLERSLRQTEFFDSQNEEGHQNFRSALPIGETSHDFHAASDGQLGGILKVYRDFLICGDLDWLRHIWPRVKASMDYCIQLWDKKREGVLKEPHHNTYDIEFWGADGMCSSFYISALKAMEEMGKVLGEDCSSYGELAEKGVQYLSSRLYNGEYFCQQVEWKDLEAKLAEEGDSALSSETSAEARALIAQHGPKYQYGKGCLSDGVLGFWMAQVCGLGQVGEQDKIASHLSSVHRYNLKENLLEHSNTQRPGYCVGDEAGLLLCTWPHGEKPLLPFVYSDEVWTGIEYQVASHLMFTGQVEKGLDVVKACRSRYQGDVRNPFDEYECGHWYARAMASYALLEGMTGIRYDAYRRVLEIKPRIQGDFDSFLATATGYGLAGVKDGKPYLKVVSGTIAVDEIAV